MENRTKTFPDVTEDNVHDFCGKYTYFKKDKVISVHKIFIQFMYYFDIDGTEENRNAFVVNCLKNEYEVVNLDGVLFFYNLTWTKEKETPYNLRREGKE